MDGRNPFRSTEQVWVWIRFPNVNTNLMVSTMVSFRGAKDVLPVYTFVS